MKEGLLGGTRDVSPRSESEEARLHVARWAGSESKEDRRLPAVGQGEIVAEWASPPDSDGLRGLAARAGMWGGPVRGVIESMNGARFVHDRLEEHGWDVLIADAAKVKGLAPLACKTDKIDARVLATLSARDLVPEIWLPDPSIRRERELARFRLHLVRHRTTLKNRIHATLIAFGHPCPVSDLFGHAGRELLDRLAIPTRGGATPASSWEPSRGEDEVGRWFWSAQQSGDEDDLPRDVTGLELGERRSNVVERVGALDRHDEVARRDAELERQLDVAAPDEVDERDHRRPLGGRRDPLTDAIAVGDGNRAVLAQP